MRKRYISIPLILIICFFVGIDYFPVQAAGLPTVQCGSANIPEALPNFSRIVVLGIQIATPVILIILGMLDFAKSTIGSDEKEINAAKGKFMKRLIAGAMVFLVVTLIKFVVGIIQVDDQNSIMNCVDCLISDESKCG